MRIVIDLQSCQSSSRFRGIGRYSLSLAEALARNAGKHEIWIALNDAIPDTVMPIRETFDGLIPKSHIRVFSVPAPIVERDLANGWRVRAAELIREHALAELEPDIVLVSSLFEGWGDDVATSIGEIDSCTNAAILYDFIPFLDQKSHLTSTHHREWYLRKLRLLERADLLLAISEHTRRDAIEKLGIASERVVNISSAVSDRFRPLDFSETDTAEMKHKYGISRPFLLYVGNLDPNKNMEGAICSYALLPNDVRKGHQFVIVSQMNNSARETLDRIIGKVGLRSDEIILAGNVQDDDLVVLYNLCKAFIFPSLYEGFGLPVLEAMSCNAPAIGSNTSSIPEVIGRKDALFDPANPSSVAEAMVRVLGDKDFRESLRVHAPIQAAKFSWDESARRALDSFESVHDKKKHIRRGKSERYNTLLGALSSIQNTIAASEDDLIQTARSISFNASSDKPKQLLVDISELVVRDSKSGIQRVARSILINLLKSPPEGFRVEPIYGTNEGVFRYANSFRDKLLGTQVSAMGDSIVEVFPDDQFLGLDLTAHLFPFFRLVLARYQEIGVNIHYVVYDITPLLYPQWHDTGMTEAFGKWMDAISTHADSLICISKSVADEVREWLDLQSPKRKLPLKIHYFHLGADIEQSVPSAGLPPDALPILVTLTGRPNFLMVSTIEPRKGHVQALDAFELLWSTGMDINLIIVGKLGWNMEAFATRLREHPELGHRLFWLEGISDEYLLKIYGVASALIFPSEAEGFGLPIIEAAQHGLSVIARDIPVLREVAGENAFYFHGKESLQLANAIREWLRLDAEGAAPDSAGIQWLTWAQSTQMLLDSLFSNHG